MLTRERLRAGTGAYNPSRRGAVLPRGLPQADGTLLFPEAARLRDPGGLLQRCGRSQKDFPKLTRV